MSDFIKIAVTPEIVIDKEASRLTKLLADREVDYIHLRHPRTSAKTLSRIMTEIPYKLLWRITLHDHFTLAEDFPIGGIHLNSRNPIYPASLKPVIERLRISRSCHTVDEVYGCAAQKHIDYKYVTLSPIFNSISKEGYNSSFDLKELSGILKNTDIDVIALGGVEPKSFDKLKEAGFAGAAMLGYYFPPH